MCARMLKCVDAHWQHGFSASMHANKKAARLLLLLHGLHWILLPRLHGRILLLHSKGAHHQGWQNGMDLASNHDNSQ